ncbi:uncharacterized protein LOC129959440 [Argiope bruennichi]|uniref:uncharacterized protein LOC129959440 n=1 Tax=Argiope bruennichi TaxID=94029 RepID=UPI002495A769|nr:uncharacterized protein LOC129959440 [Argiope bruennichi]
MEKNKEAVRKSYSDFCGNKKVDAFKANFVKSTHLSVRPDSGRNKISYIPREKNASIPINKKFGLYTNETKTFLKHSCDRCGFRSRPCLILNADSISSPPEVTRIESSHDLNGNISNISVNTHATFCNFTSTVSDISALNKVFNYQSNHHYELSFPKSSKHKQRTSFSEQKSFSSKITHSNNPFSANRFYPSLPDSRFGYHSSKGIPQNITFPEPNYKALARSTRENYSANGKYNGKYEKYVALPDACMNNYRVKLTDLSVFENPSSLKDISMTCKVDYFDEQLQIKKQNYSSKKWDIPVTSEFGESLTKNVDETDKILFPALPSTNHNQQGKLNSSYTSMPPSERSSIESSDIEITHALSGTNITLNASTVSSSVSSTIPQASYADVIRMSTTCSGIQGCVVLDNKIPEENPLVSENPVPEKLSKEENPQPGSSDWVISRLSQLDVNVPEPLGSVALNQCHQNGQNFVAPRPIVVSLEKPSFYNSSLQTCKNVLSTNPSNSTFPPIDKKVVENDSSLDDCLSSLEKNSVDSSVLPESTNRSSESSDFTTSITDTQMASMKTDSVYSSPSSVSSFGDAFKPTENRDLHLDNLLKKQPPVIIMNNYSPPGSMSEISFGIEYEEMVKLCSDNNHIEKSEPLAVQDIGEDSLSDESIKTGSSLQKTSIPLSMENALPSASSEIETTNKRINLKDKTLYWKDSDVKYNKKNYIELTDYFCNVWNDIGKELEKEKGSSRASGNTHYFHEL